MIMKKNDIIELEIVDVTHEGNGVGKFDKMAIFVPNTAVGDKIEAHILKVNKHFAFAKCNKILTPSQHRINVDCNTFARCGGCVFRHIDYIHETQIKKNRVMQTMHRIGKTALDPKDIIYNSNPDRYRNKAMYPVDLQGEIGFYSRNSHRIVACKDCMLHPTEFDIASRVFTKFVKEYNIPVYNEQSHSGLLRHFYIRQGKQTSELMVCIVINGSDIPHKEKLVEELKDALGNNLKSVIININTNKTNVVLGDNNIVIYGKEYITDILCDTKFRISPHSFYQVNHDMAELLYQKAMEYACPNNKNVLDLYCGAGTIGLSMASVAKSIIGVEVVPAAVQDANINAQENNITNARFICGDAAKAVQQLNNENITADVVILDPPRKGCEPSLLQTVANGFSPERIVYVSCDVATLARDTQILETLGYVLQEYTPVDLFPRTAHVETVALFTKGV